MEQRSRSQEQAARPEGARRQTPKPSFREQLARVLAERFPSEANKTSEARSKQAEALRARETAIQDADLNQLLTEYRIDPSRLERIGPNLYALPVAEHFSEWSLPEGYGYKGGAARELLLCALGCNSIRSPRDVDVVRIANAEPFTGADNWVAREFMPDDYAFGYGVEAIESTDDYFATRDFTISEVLATDTTIYATRACILDNVRHIIRITAYESSLIDDGRKSDKLLAKALRTYAEAIHRYDEGSIQEYEDWTYETYFISPFWLALQLDRAYSDGSEIAERFTAELIRRGQLPEFVTNAAQAAHYLSSLLTRAPFYYRHAPTEQFDAEAAFTDDSYDHTLKREGHGRRKRNT